MAANMNFQNGGRRHLGLFESKILRQRKLRPSRMYLERRPSYGCLCVLKIAAVEFIFGVDFCRIGGFWMVALYVPAKFHKSI